MICVFCPYPEKALRSLRTLRLIFFILGGRRDFYNFLSNKKTPRFTAERKQRKKITDTYFYH